MGAERGKNAHTQCGRAGYLGIGSKFLMMLAMSFSCIRSFIS